MIAGMALLVAVVAFAHSRRVARKLAMLEEQYWALKFAHGELKAKVDPPVPAAASSQQTFVPLVSLRPATKPAPGLGGAGAPPRE